MSEIVPGDPEHVPEAESRFHQAVAVLVGLVAVIAVLLAMLEADAKRRESSASATASRLATSAFVDIASSGVYTTFALSSLQDAVGVGLSGYARLISAFSHPRLQAGETAIGRAELAASKHLQSIVRVMSRPPSAADGVDAATRAAVTATVAADTEKVKRQNEATDASERYAGRGELAILGLSLSAIAATLLSLAGIFGPARQGRLLLLVALAAMLGAIASGATGIAH